MIASIALFVSAVLLSSYTTGVTAHGVLQSVTIGGKVYPAWDPFVDPSVIKTCNAVRARLNRCVLDMQALCLLVSLVLFLTMAQVGQSDAKSHNQISDYQFVLSH